jgi:hypothetical protein
MAPNWTPDQKGVKVQIVDVFALKLVTGYEKDPNGRLLLASEASVSEGRTWSLAKACQLVRNDATPHRWVVLHRHKKAWGLFWAGGGLNRCRDELAKAMGTEPQGAIVPATPEALLKLVLAMEEPEWVEALAPNTKKSKPKAGRVGAIDAPSWKSIAIITSTALVMTGAFSVYLGLELQRKSATIEKMTSQIINEAKSK